MIYNKAINNLLKNKYKDISNKCDLFADFFNHISSFSEEYQSMFKGTIPPSSIVKDYYNQIRLFNINLPTLSLIILCKNEERCIQRCLKHILQEVSPTDEIIVIDTGSNDDSLNILQNFSGIRLVKVQWENDFAQIRNLGLNLAKKSWIFFIDADEILQNGCLEQLKYYLCIIDWLNLQSLAVSPTIINHDSTIARGVRRIIKNNSELQYYGVVHEEIRKEKSLLGRDVNYISFDNVLLFHDGYQKSVIKSKNKSEIYYNGLQNMIKLEPTHPRWLFFLCRDGKTMLSDQEYEKNLLKVLDLSGNIEEFKFYKIRALSNLISLYLSKHLLDLASFYLNTLKKMVPELSDVLYYDTMINYIKHKQAFADMLNYLIIYRQNHDFDDGSLHSRLYHIDYLIATLFFEIEEYEKAFSILEDLQSKNFNSFSNNYRSLYMCLNKYFLDSTI